MKMKNKWLSYGVVSAFFWMTACGSSNIGGTSNAAPTASEQAAPNAALSSVNSSVVSALSNLGVQANLGVQGGSGLIKKQETDEEESTSINCSAENPCVDTCSGGGSITTVIAETEENVFSMTLTYAGCIEEQCGEAVTMNGVVEGQVVYNGSATATLTTGGTCGNGGLTATAAGQETDLYFNLEVVVNDISLPEEEVVVTVSGEFCTGDESQTIDSFDDFETDACMEAEESDDSEHGEDSSDETDDGETEATETSDADDTSDTTITQDTNGLCYNTACIDDLNDPTLNAVPCMGLEEAPRLACQASCQVDCPQS